MSSRSTTLALLCLFLFLSFSVFAQRIENVKATFSDGKASITYDLVAPKASQQFNIEIFGSHNNYAAPLKLVTGDVGKNIGAGAGKRIEWQASTELGVFSGEVVFKVRGQIVVTPYTFVQPADGGSIRRGKTSVIKWSGGIPEQSVKIDLMQDGKVINSVTQNAKNTGEFAWAAPADLSKGEYTLSLTSEMETTQSGKFKVKSKTPIIFFVAPVVVVGLVIILLPKKDDPKTGEVGSLPDAPGPK